MEINSQEEMANPQGMKLFAVERHGLPENYVYCPAMCGVQLSSPLVFVPNWPIVWGPLHNTVVGTRKIYVLQVYVLLSCMLKSLDRTAVCSSR